MFKCVNCFNEYSADNVCSHCGYKQGNEPAHINCIHPGTVIGGRYMIGMMLAKSNSTITYLALDGKLEKKVVIREYFPTELAHREPGHRPVVCKGDEEKFKSGVEKTVKNALALKEFDYFDGVVFVYDCFEENNTAYVVTERFEGETLADVMSKREVFSFPKTLELITPVLSALEVFHSAGYAHGLISPDKVIISPDGKAKLLDFCCDLNYGGDESVLEKHYTAPERYYAPDATVKVASDIYSACALIYKMLTGSDPIDSKERDRQTDDFSDIFDVVGLPDKAEKIILKGLSLKLDERPKSMGEVIADLTAERSKSAPTQLITSPAKKKKKPKKTSKSNAKTAIIVAVCVLLVVGIISAVAIPVALKKRNSHNNTSTTEPDTKVSSTDTIFLPNEARQKYNEFLISDLFKNEYAAIYSVRTRAFDEFPKDKKVPEGVSDFDMSTTSIYHFDLDNDGTLENIITTDFLSNRHFVSVYIFDIDKDGNVFEGGRLEWNDTVEEELEICTVRGDKGSTYCLLRYDITEDDKHSFEVMCYDGEKLICAASAAQFAEDSFACTGSLLPRDGVIWDSNEPVGVKSVYERDKANFTENLEEYNSVSKEEFDKIWEKNITNAIVKQAIKTSEITDVSIQVSFSFPGLKLNGREIELSFRTVEGNQPFLYRADGSEVLFSNVYSKKQLQNGYIVELMYGSNRYCLCQVNLDEQGNPICKVGSAELIYLPNVIGEYRSSALDKIRNAGFGVEAKRGSRAGLANLSKLGKVEKQSIMGDNYYPRDTKITIWYYG